VTKTVSFAVRTWRDPHVGATRLQVLRIDRPEEVRLTNGSFLVRVTIDKQLSTERCTIRHVASGREAIVQGGPGLSAFVEACLLESAAPRQDGAGTRQDADRQDGARASQDGAGAAEQQEEE